MIVIAVKRSTRLSGRYLPNLHGFWGWPWALHVRQGGGGSENRNVGMQYTSCQSPGMALSPPPFPSLNWESKATSFYLPKRNQSKLDAYG